MSPVFPPTWQSAPLGSLASKIGSGSTPRGGKKTYNASGIPLIRSMNVHFNGFRTEGLAFLDEQQASTLDNVTVQPGDVLLNITGASIGRVTQAPPTMAGARVNQHVCIIRPFEGIDPRFVARYLESPAMQAFIAGENYGMTRQALTKQMIEGIIIPIPPLAEQRRIVARLEMLLVRTAGVSAHLDHLPALIANYKKHFLDRAISGELTRDWRKGHPLVAPVPDQLQKIREHRSKDSKLSKRKVVQTIPDASLPAGWQWISPDEIADDLAYSIGIGPFGSNLVRSDYKNQGVRLVFVRDIRRERFDEADAKYVTMQKARELRQHLVKGGEVLITKMGDPPGDTALYPASAKPALITADCIKLRPHETLARPDYLVFCIRSELVRRQIAAITMGVAHQKVSLDRFRQIALPMPPLAEQQEIVRRIERAFSRIDKIGLENSRAVDLIFKLNQAILTKAFSGELVPQDPSDEPASELLARIHYARAEFLQQERGRTSAYRLRARTPREKSAMTKSRHDDDVRDRPYLANILKTIGKAATVEELFNRAQLPVTDFYKQLAWEVDAGHIHDDNVRLEPA